VEEKNHTCRPSPWYDCICATKTIVREACNNIWNGLKHNIDYYFRCRKASLGVPMKFTVCAETPSSDLEHKRNKKKTATKKKNSPERATEKKSVVRSKIFRNN